jgi:hypothetical protein
MAASSTTTLDRRENFWYGMTVEMKARTKRNDFKDDDGLYTVSESHIGRM